MNQSRRTQSRGTQGRGRAVLILSGAVLGLMLAALLAMLGLDAPFALAWGIVLVALLGIARTDPGSPDAEWPPPAPPMRRQGSEVSRLAWAFDTRRDTVGLAVRRRIHGLLRRRLGAEGLDIDEPADRAEAERLLGRGVLDLALGEQLRRADVDTVLDAIERLNWAALNASTETRKI